MDSGARASPAAADRTIAEIATRQHGLVSRRQLLDAGISGHRIDRRVRTGALILVHRGVYRVGPIVGVRGMEMAAVLACGGHADPTAAHTVALAQWTAAAMRSIAAPRRGPIQLVAAGCAGRRRPGLGVRRVPSLPADAVSLVDGIPVTTACRTLVDLAAIASPHDLERAFALALRLEIITRDLMRAAIADRAGHRGTRMLRTLIEKEADPAFTRSEAEQLLLRLIRKARVPEPEVNEIAERLEVDFLWRKQKVVVEVDGFAFHRSRRAFERDRDRDGVLVSAGFRVIRLTWRQIRHEPLAAVARIALALGR